MNRIIAIAALLLIGSHLSRAQQQTEFFVVHGNPGYSQNNDWCFWESADNDEYVVASVGHQAQSICSITHIDPNGGVIGGHEYQAQSLLGTDLGGLPDDIDRSESGEFYVSGTLIWPQGAWPPQIRREYYLMKLANDGSLAWMRGSQLGSNHAWWSRVAATPDGGAAFAYSSDCQSDNQGICLIKTDGSGNQQWFKNIKALEDRMMLIDVLATPGDGILVVASDHTTGPGPLGQPADFEHIRLFQFDQNGLLLWNTLLTYTGRNPGGPNQGCYANNVLIDGAGNIVIQGTTNPAPWQNMIAKLEGNSGNVLWAKEYSHSKLQYLWEVAVDDSDNIYTGMSARMPVPGTTGTPLVKSGLVKLDHNGTPVWTRQVGNEQDYPWLFMANDLDVDSRGNLATTVMVLTQTQNNTQQPALLVTNTNGYHNSCVDSANYILSEVEVPLAAWSTEVLIDGVPSWWTPPSAVDGISIDEFYHCENTIWKAEHTEEMTDDNASTLLYPNPGSGQFSIVHSGGAPETIELTVVNAMGQTVLQEQLQRYPNQPIRFDLTGLPKGMYMVSLESAAERHTERLILR